MIKALHRVSHFTQHTMSATFITSFRNKKSCKHNYKYTLYLLFVCVCHWQTKAGVDSNIGKIFSNNSQYKLYKYGQEMSKCVTYATICRHHLAMVSHREWQLISCQHFPFLTITKTLAAFNCVHLKTLITNIITAFLDLWSRLSMLS